MKRFQITFTVEMYILKDLAEDSLKEIREDMQRDKQRSR